jgi:sulfoacetaldehyde dehydrogenase
MAEREITQQEVELIDTLLARANAAAKIIESYDQARVDKLIQAVAWSVANLKTWKELSYEAVAETGLGDDRSARLENA